jgi:hypothetical protein
MSFHALLCLIYAIAHQLLAAVTGQIPLCRRSCKKFGVAELRYDKWGQGMFWLPDLPRLRAIEIIG